MMRIGKWHVGDQAELVFNFADDQPLWTELLLRVAVGDEHYPGMPHPVKAGVKDEAAFRASLAAILAWDSDRIIVGHGDVLETGGKEKLRAALGAADRRCEPVSAAASTTEKAFG